MNNSNLKILFYNKLYLKSDNYFVLIIFKFKYQFLASNFTIYKQIFIFFKYYNFLNFIIFFYDFF